MGSIKATFTLADATAEIRFCSGQWPVHYDGRSLVAAPIRSSLLSQRLPEVITAGRTKELPLPFIIINASVNVA